MRSAAEAGVYVIENLCDGKVYVGSTSDLVVRRARHWRDLRRGEHRNCHLQNAFDRDGSTAFAFRILETCATEELLIVEQKWIVQFHAYDRAHGYNLIVDAERRSHSPETVERIRLAHRGRTFSPEHRASIGAAARARPPMSVEQRGTIRAQRLGTTLSADTRAKISAALRGNTHSAGRKLTDAHKAAVSAAHKGKPKSAEHRAKISASRRRNRSSHDDGGTF